MDFNITDIERRIKSLPKQHLEKLYDYIDEYFNNSEKYGLQAREGQYDMALSVYQAIESLDHLVIEAGVGIGKSYAYLVPLLYYHKLTGRPFIISTSTIALQEQLEKDIQKLSEQLDIPIDIVIAKGMTNFLCLNRLEMLSNIKGEEKLVNKVKDDKQDRKDYVNIKDSDWKKLCVENCTYNKCQNHNDCEFYRRREQMRSTSGVIICNHDLLINDLHKKKSIYGNSLFKNVDFIVCDEAHNLENKVRSFKTNEMNIESSKYIINRAIRLLAKYNNYNYNPEKISNKIDKLTKIISDNVNKEIERLRNQGIDLVDCNGIEFKFDEDVVSISKELVKTLDNMIDSIQIHADYETEDIETELYTKLEMFEILSMGEKGNNLFWIEHRGKKNYVYYAPKNIDQISYDLFFNRSEFDKMFRGSSTLKSFIFTSATLSVGKSDYSYFLKNIGADRVPSSELTCEYSYDSPYDYDNNTILYCCNDIESPSKNKEKYLNQLVEKIKELIKLTNGKTMVLFTSKSDMNYVYSKIGNKIDDINIYIQNDGSSQDVVKNKFKDDINSVLFSTGIFWEGIDIKGESLSNLIIARLPFPVVDPIMQYKKSVYGKEGFKKVYIPEMLIKLKQGVGRLIRSEDDKGIVCILDSRMNDKYQEVIKRSLPIKNFTNNIEDVKKLVKKFNIDK